MEAVAVGDLEEETRTYMAAESIRVIEILRMLVILSDDVCTVVIIGNAILVCVRLVE